MRTLLLLFIAMLVMGSTMAQRAFRNDLVPVKNTIINNQANFLDKEPAIPSNFNGVPVPPKNGTKALNSTLVGSSINLYSILLEAQTVLAYDEDANSLLFTCRGNQLGSVAVLGTGNDLTNHYSFDHGTTWSHKLSIVDGSRHRYPSGVVYNPAGNTDTSALYSVMEGPLTDGTNWIDNYFCSDKIDLTGAHTQLITMPTTHLTLIREGLTATKDGKFHVATYQQENNGTIITFLRLVYANATWNTGTNTATWDTSGFIPNYTSSGTGGIYGTFTANEAWSRDGSIGYLMTLGSDNRPSQKPAQVPLIYKSTDGGATWTQLPYFNYDTVTAITDHIFPTSISSQYRPYFDEASIVVDHDGLPHIFAIIRGGASTNVDSLNYVWQNPTYGTMPDGNMFEVYMDNSNLWHAIWVDSIQTNFVTTTVSPLTSSTGNIQWNHFVQASATPDGYKVFGTWTDSDWQFWGTDPYDLNPDLMGWGRDLLNQTAPYMDAVNFTKNTPLWGIAYFHHTSRIAFDKGSGDVYTVPVTVTDLATGGMNADNPVYHYYVSGIDFSNLNVGINNNKAANFKVSATYPNPVSGKAKVDVTLNSAASISIETTNVTGQVMMTRNYGSFNSGTHTLYIDATQLSSGVYFNTVTVGSDKITNKMIVK